MNFSSKAREIVNDLVAKKTLSVGIGKCEKIVSEALKEAYRMGEKEVEDKVLRAIQRKGKTIAKKRGSREDRKKVVAS